MFATPTQPVLPTPEVYRQALEMLQYANKKRYADLQNELNDLLHRVESADRAGDVDPHRQVSPGRSADEIR
jgi:hypothetical protein